MKLRLTVIDGTLSGQERTLVQGSLLLGRSMESDLRFEDSGSVSTRHAAIQATSLGFEVVDQQSRNGTLLNGNVVSRATLTAGDELQLAPDGPRLRVAIEESTPAIEATLKPTREIRSALAVTFYDPDKDKGEGSSTSGLLRLLGILGAGAMMLALSVVVLLLMAVELSVTGAFAGTFMAFAPAPVYLFLFLWMDRFDPEPAWALAACFAWGGLFAIVPSYILNSVFGAVTTAMAGAPAGNAVSIVVSAPIVEELAKGLGVILVLLLLRSELDGVLDGIVYAGVTALGFATVENVFYYGREIDASGAGGALVLGFLRGVLSPFSHALFTSMTGIGCGIARETHRTWLKLVAPVVGLGLAMTLHALWNGIAFALGGLFFVFYLLVWIPLFLLFLVLVVAMSLRERRIVREMLGIEVDVGFVPAEHRDICGSLTRRFRWVLGGGSPGRMLARRRYLKGLTKLAFCHWHVSRATESATETISLPRIPIIKAEMRALKARI